MPRGKEEEACALLWYAIRKPEGSSRRRWRFAANWSAWAPKFCFPGTRGGSLREDADQLIAASDVVVALGGDGTIIHTAKTAPPACNRAVLGVNCGHLGFMAGLEADELEHLSALIDGKYSVEERMLLRVQVLRDGGEAVPIWRLMKRWFPVDPFPA